MYVTNIWHEYKNYYNDEHPPCFGPYKGPKQGNYYYFGSVPAEGREEEYYSIIIHEKYYNWLKTHNVLVKIISQELYVFFPLTQDWMEFTLKYV